LIRLLLINSLVLIIIVSCTGQYKNFLESKKVIIDDREMLYGAIDRKQLYFDYPDWKQIEADYKPVSQIIEQIKDNITGVSIDIFLGTWCGDSKREVPAFFKIIDSVRVKNTLDIKVWAVDRKKTLDNGLAQKCNIEYVPTFVFYRSNREIGRIVEMPEGLLEEDILNIIQEVLE